MSLWLSLTIMAVIVLIVSFLLIDEYEHFKTISFPRRDQVLYRQCQRGSVPTSKNTCCPEKDYDMNTGKCTANECTTDKSKWIQMPICRQSHKGIIQSYGEQTSCVTAREYFTDSPIIPTASNLTVSEYLSTEGTNKIGLCGKGLPCTTLNTDMPMPKLSMYDNTLITVKGQPVSGATSFGFYIHNNKPYLVTPLERFNDFEHVVLPLEPGIWSELEYNGRNLPMTSVNSGWDRIEEQSWYTQFNPLMQYNGQLLRHSVKATAWAFIYGGKAYALWGSDCSLQKVTVKTIPVTNPITDLLPTSKTFHHFSLAYKQPWYNDLLPDCQTNQQVLAHF